MATVLDGNGSILFQGATPDFGTPWEGVDSGNLIGDASAYTAEELVEAMLSDALNAQLDAGTAPIELVSANSTGGAQVATFAGLTVKDAPGTLGDLSIPKGLFISSGSTDIPFYNTQSGYSLNTDGGHDQDLLDILTTAFPGRVSSVNDSYALDVEFKTLSSDVESLTFNIVFGSEEFPEYADDYVDGAAVIVDGVNYALFGGEDARPLSVTSSNITGGFFYNNSGDTGDELSGGNVVLPFEYDGLSQSLRITAPLGDTADNIHTLKIVIGDTNDSDLDSGMWIGNLDVSSSQNPFLGQEINLDESPPAADFFSQADIEDKNSAPAAAFIAQYGQSTYDLLMKAAQEGQIINDKDGDYDSNLYGFGGDDQLFGKDGDDAIFGNGGDDAIDGGDGSDIAGFAGSIDDYEIKYDPASNSLKVRDISQGGSGTDTLVAVEYLKFGDTTVSVLPFLKTVNVSENGDTLIERYALDGTKTSQTYVHDGLREEHAYVVAGKPYASQNAVYDSADKLISMTRSYADGSPAFSQIVKPDGSQTVQAWKPDGTFFIGEFDTNGRLASAVGYDSQDRLLSKDLRSPDGGRETHLYDPATGKETNSTVFHPDKSRVEANYAVTGKLYAEQTASYDASGKLAEMKRYYGDAAHTLAFSQVKHADGSTEVHSYDTAGRETVRLVGTEGAERDVFQFAYAGAAATPSTQTQTHYRADGLKQFVDQTKADGSHEQTASAGDAHLVSHAGVVDLMKGFAGGADTFVFGAGFGKDTVSGFEAGSGRDVLRIDSALVADYATFAGKMAGAGGDTLIALSASDTILVKGILPAALDPAHVQFVSHDLLLA